MLLFQDDGDVVSMVRGNNGHVYLYVGGMGGHCGWRSLGSEQPQRPDGEANIVRVVELRGLVGCENEIRDLVPNEEGAGAVWKLSR